MNWLKIISLILTETLGTKIQNDIYRHILVSVISELWVEYLTRVDALRVSIGLEALCSTRSPGAIQEPGSRNVQESAQATFVPV